MALFHLRNHFLVDPAANPKTIEELYYASQKNPYYKELFYQRILALEAEEEALVAPHVEGAAVGDYPRQGFLPQAVVNFIALLGWSSKT